MRSRSWLILVFVVALFAAGCSDDEGGDTAADVPDGSSSSSGGSDSSDSGSTDSDSSDSDPGSTDSDSSDSDSSDSDPDSTDSDSDMSEGGGETITIGFMLPETAVIRYESKDRPFFEERLTEICPDCELLYANANGDPSEQNRQALAMLADGVDVLVVDPFDGVAAASIVEAATAQGVPVIAYDRLISSPDLSYVVTNNYYDVGVLQGQELVAALEASGVDPADGGILMMNGAVTDNNAGSIKAGALSVIEPSGYRILESIETWDPAEAQRWVASQILVFGDQVRAIYSANDANAGGALAALKAAGVEDIPPMTGLDADIAAIQRILVGEQLMTTYNAFRTEARIAADLAYAIATGEEPETEDEIEGIPAVLNPPASVTIDTILDTVIADGFYQLDEICTEDYADACAAAGLE